MGYTIPSYFEGYWSCVFSILLMDCDKLRPQLLLCNIEILSVNIRDGGEKHGLWFSH